MSERNTVVRSLHDLGLAAWFGSLAGAVAVNGAAADVPDPTMRLRVANAGWARWTPVNAVAIGAHLIGGTGLLWANRDRVATQHGVGAMTVAKLVLTAGALAVTAYSGVLSRKLQQADGVPVEGATDPAPTTPPTNMSYSEGKTSFRAVRRCTNTRPSASRASTNAQRCRNRRAYTSARSACPTTRSRSSTTSSTNRPLVA